MDNEKNKKLNSEAEEAIEEIVEETVEEVKKAHGDVNTTPHETTFVFDDEEKIRENEERSIRAKRNKNAETAPEDEIDFEAASRNKKRKDDQFRNKKNRDNQKRRTFNIDKSKIEKTEKSENTETVKTEKENSENAKKQNVKKNKKFEQDDYIKFENVKKVYRMGEVEIEALGGVDFSISKGEFVIIAGASGAGKSTILNILGGMDSLSSGRILVDGNEVSKYDEKQLVSYRRYDVGFVFQFYNLVQNLNALENVQLATQICKNPLDALQTIKDVGLEERKNNFPAQLSGGEQQRVAIARALAKNPKLLLCDEPTGALDYKTGKQILKLLQETSRNTGMTVVVITHNLALTAMGDKVIKVKSGKIESIEINENPLDVDLIEY